MGYRRGAKTSQTLHQGPGCVFYLVFPCLISKLHGRLDDLVETRGSKRISAGFVPTERPHGISSVYRELVAGRELQGLARARETDGFQGESRNDGAGIVKLK